MREFQTEIRTASISIDSLRVCSLSRQIIYILINIGNFLHQFTICGIMIHALRKCHWPAPPASAAPRSAPQRPRPGPARARKGIFSRPDREPIPPAAAHRRRRAERAASRYPRCESPCAEQQHAGFLVISTNFAVTEMTPRRTVATARPNAYILLDANIDSGKSMESLRIFAL